MLTNTPVRLSVIASLFRKRNFYKIIDMIEKEQRYSKGQMHYKVLYYQALSYVNVEKYHNALRVLEMIIDRESSATPLVYQCRMLKGYLYCRQEEYIIAIQEFEKLLDEGYESTMIYSALAHAVFNINKKDYALQCLEKALELDSDNINALNSLSYILAKYDMDLNKSRQYIEKVLRSDPRNPSYLDTYGYVLYKSNHLKEAEKILTYAYSLNAHRMIKKHLDEVRHAQMLV